MLFPDRLIVRVVMAPDWRPVCGVGVQLTLHAAIKNHYDLLGMTDDRGEAVFTRAMVEAEIVECQRASPMDYASSLAECSPVLRIRTLEDVAPVGSGMVRWNVTRRKRWASGGMAGFYGFRCRDIWRAVGGENAGAEMVIEVRVWGGEGTDYGGP